MAYLARLEIHCEPSHPLAVLVKDMANTCRGTQGSVLVFNNLIKPFVKPYEPLLDFIARIVGDIVTILFAIVAFGPVWIKRKWDARRAIEEVSFFILF